MTMSMGLFLEEKCIQLSCIELGLINYDKEALIQDVINYDNEAVIQDVINYDNEALIVDMHH